MQQLCKKAPIWIQQSLRGVDAQIERSAMSATSAFNRKNQFRWGEANEVAFIAGNRCCFKNHQGTELSCFSRSPVFFFSPFILVFLLSHWWHKWLDLVECVSTSYVHFHESMAKRSSSLVACSFAKFPLQRCVPHVKPHRWLSQVTVTGDCHRWLSQVTVAGDLRMTIAPDCTGDLRRWFSQIALTGYFHWVKQT